MRPHLSSIGIVLALLALILILSSCGVQQAPGPNNIRKWTDPETGCVYLQYGSWAGNASYGSLSIRYRTDGTPDCPGTRS